MFGIDAAGCLLSYTYTGTSDDFTMLIRPRHQLSTVPTVQTLPFTQ